MAEGQRTVHRKCADTSGAAGCCGDGSHSRRASAERCARDSMPGAEAVSCSAFVRHSDSLHGVGGRESMGSVARGCRHRARTAHTSWRAHRGRRRRPCRPRGRYRVPAAASTPSHTRFCPRLFEARPQSGPVARACAPLWVGSPSCCWRARSTWRAVRARTRMGTARHGHGTSWSHHGSHCVPSLGRGGHIDSKPTSNFVGHRTLYASPATVWAAGTRWPAVLRIEHAVRQASGAAAFTEPQKGPGWWKRTRPSLARPRRLSARAASRRAAAAATRPRRPPPRGARARRSAT